MDYNTMDYIPNGIIISNIKKSEVIYINKCGRDILKIDSLNQVTSLSQFITTMDTYSNLRTHIIEDNQKHGVSDGIAYLKAFDDTMVEVKFVCVADELDPSIVTYIFSKATEVTTEKEISFKELSDELPDGVIISDIQNELFITYANDKHSEILGIDSPIHSDEPLEKRLIKDFIQIEDLSWVMTEIYSSFLKTEIDIEFRTKVNGDSYKWVRLYGRSTFSLTGKKMLHASITDLSERNHIHDELHMERVLFYKITEIIEDRLFRIDLTTQILHFLGNKNNAFGEVAVLENYKETLLQISKIHTEDVKIYKSLIEHFESGIEKSAELRYLVNEDEFEWFKIKYSFIRNSHGKPISVVGKIININAQKILEEQASKDLLTNFYNKVTTEDKINQLIHSNANEKHAFFIIDIDNFKAINDNLGHHFGDMVLSDIADDIRNCFRTKDILGRINGREVSKTATHEGFSIRGKDILGRIGGDEFTILMLNVDDEQIVIEKAKTICNKICRTFSNNENTNSYSISASVGISMYPMHGNDYRELYINSDIALYNIKRNCKNGYQLYSEKLTNQVNKRISNDTDNSNYNVSNINVTVLSYVLNLLYETKDLSTSINVILKYISGIYDVDNCYIFEMTEDGNSQESRYKCTGQCGSHYLTQDNNQATNKDNNSQNTITQNFHDCSSKENLTSILSQTDDDGIFFTNDISSIKDNVIREKLERENVKSLLLIESLRHDEECIILGLEDCKNEREWTESEVSTLLYLGRLIFTAVNNDHSRP